MTSAFLTKQFGKNGNFLPLPNPIGNGGNILPPNLIRNGKMSQNPYKRFLAKPRVPVWGHALKTRMTPTHARHRWRMSEKE